MENNQQEKVPNINVQSSPEKIVPKFCTNITVGLLSNKNIVLTMTYSESADQSILIERILIELDHAKSLHNALNKIIEDAENVPTT